MRRFMTGLALAAAIAVAGCDTVPIYNPTNVAFAPVAATPSSPLTLEDYKNAIIRAGAERGWSFEDVGPGHLVGTVAVRGKHFATVDVLYNTQDFTINYKDSRNLDYDPGKNQIHKNYNSWVTNLQKDIQAEVVRLRAS